MSRPLSNMHQQTYYIGELGTTNAPAATLTHFELLQPMETLIGDHNIE